jgi:hypothetical protein
MSNQPALWTPDTYIFILYANHADTKAYIFLPDRENGWIDVWCVTPMQRKFLLGDTRHCTNSQCKTYIACTSMFMGHNYRMYEKECTQFNHYCWKNKQSWESKIFTTRNRYLEIIFPYFFNSLHFDLCSLCCSHNVHPVFKCPETDACARSCAQDRTSIVRKTPTVPLSCDENNNLLALFIFSLKMFKMCAPILGHHIYQSKQIYVRSMYISNNNVLLRLPRFSKVICRSLGVHNSHHLQRGQQ